MWNVLILLFHLIDSLGFQISQIASFQPCSWDTWCQSDSRSFVCGLFCFLEAFRIFPLSWALWNFTRSCLGMDLFSSSVLGISFPSRNSHLLFLADLLSWWLDNFFFVFCLECQFLRIMSLLNWYPDLLSFLVHFHPPSYSCSLFLLLPGRLSQIYLLILSSNFSYVLLFLISKTIFECSFAHSLLVSFFVDTTSFFYLSENIALFCFLSFLYFCIVSISPKFRFSLLLVFCFVFCFPVEAFFKYLVILRWSFTVRSHLKVYWKVSLSRCGFFPGGYAMRRSGWAAQLENPNHQYLKVFSLSFLRDVVSKAWQ